jgi:hypothetical protein
MYAVTIIFFIILNLASMVPFSCFELNYNMKPFLKKQFNFLSNSKSVFDSIICTADQLNDRTNISFLLITGVVG